MYGQTTHAETHTNKPTQLRREPVCLYLSFTHSCSHNSCRKCSVLTVGFTANVPIWVCIQMPIMGIWYVAVYIWTFTWVKDHYHKLHDSGFICCSVSLHFQFNSSSPFLPSYFNFGPFLSISLIVSLSCSFSFSLSLSLCLYMSLSLSLWEPGAQLRVRSQFPHREGLRDNQGCWQEISLGHTVPRAPLIRFPSKK